MNSADLSIIVLAGLFIFALIPRAHLGLAAFPAAFLVGLATGVPTNDVVGFFPSSFFILIVGVMSLFAVVQVTGAMDWIVDKAFTLVRGRIALVPIIPFLLGALITAIGTLPVAAIAIMAPIAMGLARQYRIPPFLMAFVVLNGIGSGLFSPVAVFGLTASEMLNNMGLDVPQHSSWLIATASIGLGVLTTSIVMALYWRTLRQLTADAAEPSEETEREDTRPRGPRIAALLGIVVLIVCGAGFQLDLGFTAFTITFVLLMVLRLQPADIVSRVPWGAVLLIGGLLTYVGLMEHLGAFERLSELLTVGDSAALGLLVVCYVAAITSFLANSIAVIVSTLPLLPPLIAAGVNPLGAVIAVLLSAVLVDLNPLGPTGGLILGATAEEDRQKLFRQLLAYGLGATVIAPVVLWAMFGLW